MSTESRYKKHALPLVLLVDDHPDNLQVLGQILAEDSIELAVARSGQEALEFAREDPPDLILLDIGMPGLDGWDVCKLLKRDYLTSTIPVIFLTARDEVDDVVRGFEAGAVDYVTKPFRPAELRARVRTHLQLHQLRSMLAICCYCNCVREEDGTWERLEAHIHKRTGTHFSHSMCPTCLETHFPSDPK